MGISVYQLLLLIIWGIVGIIAGALAKKIHHGNSSSSKLFNILIGLIGACVSGTLFLRIYGQLVETSTGSTTLVVSDTGVLFIGTTVCAIAGAVALVFVTGMLKSKKQ